MPKISTPHLLKKKNGVYIVLWRSGGKQHQWSTNEKNLDGAKRALVEFWRDGKADKVKPKGLSCRFYDFCDEFLAWKAPQVAEASAKEYRVALDKAKSAIGDIPCRDLTTHMLDSFILGLMRSGNQPPTVNKTLRHFKHAIKIGIRWKYIDPDVEMPARLEEREKNRFITIEQLHQLFEKFTDDEFQDFCLLSAYTGLRRTEVLRLTVSDIDNPAPGYLRIGSEQKNRTEARIPFNEETVRDILDRCVKRAKSKRRPRLFRFTSPDWISEKFRIYAVKAGLGQFRFHDLRHTYASSMAIIGEKEFKIQGLMRHKSMTSTMVYTKLMPEHLRSATEKVDYGYIPLPSERAKLNEKKES